MSVECLSNVRTYLECPARLSDVCLNLSNVRRTSVGKNWRRENKKIGVDKINELASRNQASATDATHVTWGIGENTFLVMVEIWIPPVLSSSYFFGWRRLRIINTFED